jgi:signal recognition particle receptor subunit beta
LTLKTKNGTIALKMFINHTSKQVTAKIVYYGTGLSGKTTNLQYIYSITNPKSRGELVSMETDIERTLFFDLLPLEVGSINGYQTKFQLYTVPGQIFYDSTRKIVLKGADGIVFVGDSQELMAHGNIESFENLKKNLIDQNIDINKIPLVIQYNKRDLKNIASVESLNRSINHLNVPFFEAVAINGKGVIETLRSISTLTLAKIKREIDSSMLADKTINKVSFDTDKSNQIMSIEDIPQKRISVDNIEDLELQIEVETDSKEYNIEKMQEEEKILNLEKTQEVHPASEVPIRVPVIKQENNIVSPKSEIPKIQKKIQPETKSPSKKLDSLKKGLFSKDNLKLLNSLEDNSRKTIIKKIKFDDINNTIEIKDSNANLLESINLSISPKTKKVTLIIDVKR